MYIYLYESLKGLSALTPFVSEAQARRATIEYKEANPSLGFLTVVTFDRELTDKERKAYQPPTEFPAMSELW
jgi:hypothetical protein